jgi:hypothetical protein
MSHNFGFPAITQATPMAYSVIPAIPLICRALHNDKPPEAPAKKVDTRARHQLDSLYLTT